jgi:AcrR family transcriptional regulator
VRDEHTYERKLEQILRQAAAVFCERGYHGASMRDVARVANVSLAGLYYYVSSKEHLLYLIQRHSFETILTSARAALDPVDDSEQRLRKLIRLHLRFFIEHPHEMKVLTHEERSLGDEWRREVHAVRKAYYQLCFEQVERLKQERKIRGLNTRLAVLSLFGMMNWIYMWYRPGTDPDAEILSGVMAEIFLRGIAADRGRRVRPAGALRALRPKMSAPLMEARA